MQIKRVIPCLYNIESLLFVAEEYGPKNNPGKTSCISRLIGKSTPHRISPVFALWDRGELQLYVLHGPRARRVGVARGTAACRSVSPLRPLGDAGRRAGGPRTHSEKSGLTAEEGHGGLTASTSGSPGSDGCNGKAEGKVTRCRPPHCGRLPPLILEPLRQPRSGSDRNP